MGVQRIPTVDLGAQGPPVGVQGMGCMGISGYPGTDAAGARTALEAALEEGVTFFDTADIYGRGANEEFLAPFLRAHRDEVVLSTKFGRERPKPLDLDDKFVRNDAAYVREAVDRSLKRLDTDYIDVYSLHVRNPSIPWAESIGAMAELITQGKVRYLGLSRISGDELREAHAIHPISAVQTEWSLFDRADAETSLAAAAAELGVAVVAFSPLGRGFLTGSYVDAVKDLPDKDPRRAPDRRQRRGEREPAHARTRHRRGAPRLRRPGRPGLGPPARRGARLHGRADPGHPQGQPGTGEHGGDPTRPRTGRVEPPRTSRRQGARRGRLLNRATDPDY
jgi:aryl-alcohol dehydrogenase-like predicted oxidoreductase